MAYGTRRSSAAQAEMTMTNPIPISASHSGNARSSSQLGPSPTQYRRSSHGTGGGSGSAGSYYSGNSLTPNGSRINANGKGGGGSNHDRQNGGGVVVGSSSSSSGSGSGIGSYRDDSEKGRKNLSQMENPPLLSQAFSSSSTSESNFVGDSSSSPLPGFSTLSPPTSSSKKMADDEDALDGTLLSSSIGKTRRPSTLAAQRRRLSNSTGAARPLKESISSKPNVAVGSGTQLMLGSGSGGVESMGVENGFGMTDSRKIGVENGVEGMRNLGISPIQSQSQHKSSTPTISQTTTSSSTSSTSTIPTTATKTNTGHNNNNNDKYPNRNGSLISPSSSLPSTVNLLTIGHGNPKFLATTIAANEATHDLHLGNGHNRARSVSVGSGAAAAAMMNGTGLQLTGLGAPGNGGEMMMELGDGEDGEVKSLGHLGKKEKAHLFECEKCNKVYRHSTCLVKHRWEHTAHWKEASKLLLSKHQQVQLLEAAAILKAASLGSSLPDEKSYWPAAVSPPSSGLLGSQSLNINTVLSPRLYSSQVLRSEPPLGEDDLLLEEEEEDDDDDDDDDIFDDGINGERSYATGSDEAVAVGGGGAGSTSASTEGTDSLSDEIDNDQDDANESVSTFGTTSGDGDGDYQQAHMMLVDDMFDMEIDSDESNHPSVAVHSNGTSVLQPQGQQTDIGLIVNHHHRRPHSLQQQQHHQQQQQNGLTNLGLAVSSNRSHSIGQDSGFGSLPETIQSGGHSEQAVSSSPIFLAASPVRGVGVGVGGLASTPTLSSATTPNTMTGGAGLLVAAAPAMGFFNVGGEQNELNLTNHRSKQQQQQQQQQQRRNGLSVSPSAVV